MGSVKIPYYVVKHGKGYWQPTKTMRAKGLHARNLGRDGPDAWAEAWRLNEDWQNVRKGLAEPPARSYPPYSIGWAWERFRRTETWEDWEIARIAKQAWREGYRGLAALLAVAWDSQFSPVDCRMLTPSQHIKDSCGAVFDTSRAKTGKDAIGTTSRRTERVLAAYISRLPIDLHADAPIFRNRSGLPYSKDTLGDDFRNIRNKVFPGDTRRMMDIRRTGAVEALAGGADLGGIGNKMANSLEKSKALQKVYLPKRAANVKLIDEARKRGRKVLGENG
jgi:hypothetical protein